MVSTLRTVQTFFRAMYQPFVHTLLTGIRLAYIRHESNGRRALDAYSIYNAHLDQPYGRYYAKVVRHRQGMLQAAGQRCVEAAFASAVADCEKAMTTILRKFECAS